MASNILTSDINELYPVAGADNDSQGFRDNFRLVKTGLATAATEITSLQTTTAKLNASNDFNGNVIREANFIANTAAGFTGSFIDPIVEVYGMSFFFLIFAIIPTFAGFLMLISNKKIVKMMHGIN